MTDSDMSGGLNSRLKIKR